MKSRRRSEWISTQRQHEWTTSASMLLLLLLLVGLSLAMQPVQADCSECCSPRGVCSAAFRRREGICCGVLNDRPFCCPQGATCVQKSSSRFACRMAYSQGGGTTDAGGARGYDDEPVCGFGCVLAITLAIIFCLPCCCFLGYRGYMQRQRSLEEAEAARAPAGGWPRPPSYPPPVSYAATYGSGPSGWGSGSGEVPRGPPNSPAQGYFPGSGPGSGPGPKQWEGPAYRMDEGPTAFRPGEVPYAAQAGTAFPSSSGGGGSYPGLANSPRPREGADVHRPPPTTAEQSRSWLGSSGGHPIAEPDAASRPPPYAAAVSAPGGIATS